jgi:hypothetical protein
LRNDGKPTRGSRHDAAWALVQAAHSVIIRVFTRITEAETFHSGFGCVYIQSTDRLKCNFHNVLFPLPKDSSGRFIYAWREAGGTFKTSAATAMKKAGFSGGMMLWSCRSVPPPITLPRFNSNTFDILKVMFSTAGDLIRVHSYDNQCSATWDVCLSYGRFESEQGDGLIDLMVVRPPDRHGSQMT